jgi:hypothetical protein
MRALPGCPAPCAEAARRFEAAMTKAQHGGEDGDFWAAIAQLDAELQALESR